METQTTRANNVCLMFDALFSLINAGNVMQSAYVVYVFLGANACVQLQCYEEAISWCEKGLAVSFHDAILCSLLNRTINEQYDTFLWTVKIIVNCRS